MDGLGSLPALHTLDLRYNTFNGGELRFRSLSFLRNSLIKDLSMHAPTELLQSAPYLPNLQSLELKAIAEYYTIHLPASLPGMCSLRRLCVDCLEHDMVPVGLSTLTALTHLQWQAIRLQEGEAVRDTAAVLGRMTQLQSLRLQAHQDLQPFLLSSLTGLMSLSIESARLGSAGTALEIPTSLTRLTRLDLSHCALLRMPCNLTHFKALEILDLSNQDEEAVVHFPQEDPDDSFEPYTSSTFQLDENLLELVTMPALRCLHLGQDNCLEHAYSEKSLYFALAAEEIVHQNGDKCWVFF